MSAPNKAALMAAVLAASMPLGVGSGRRAFDGVPASPEDRARRDAEREARRDRLVAKADAKRARKAARRAVSPSDQQAAAR